MAYSAGTQYTWQSLNDKQRTHGFTDDNFLSVKPCMLFFIQTLPRILCASTISRVSLLDLFWTDCRDNKSYCIITSLANYHTLGLEYRSTYVCSNKKCAEGNRQNQNDCGFCFTYFGLMFYAALHV